MPANVGVKSGRRFNPSEPPKPKEMVQERKKRRFRLSETPLVVG